MEGMCHAATEKAGAVGTAFYDHAVAGTLGTALYDHAAEAAGTVATVLYDHAVAHPKSTAFTAASVGLAPVLGPAWPLTLPLKALGFGSLGLVAGSTAAWLQSTQYGAYVPAGSLFSLAQWAGMTL
ncbi:MAG: hypothetical protein M1832_002817 [Thelocarpon impressellum]|nr:MAG: hypothetical protein M1832_002817 [Thelocarpon impressellum]